MASTSKPTVEELHRVWDAANQRVRHQERLLAAALEIYGKGTGPLPQQMIDEVQLLRVDCNSKFKALMEAVGKQS